MGIFMQWSVFFLSFFGGRDPVANLWPPGGAMLPEKCPLVANVFAQRCKITGLLSARCSGEQHGQGCLASHTHCPVRPTLSFCEAFFLMKMLRGEKRSGWKWRMRVHRPTVEIRVKEQGESLALLSSLQVCAASPGPGDQTGAGTVKRTASICRVPPGCQALSHLGG